MFSIVFYDRCLPGHTDEPQLPFTQYTLFYVLNVQINMFLLCWTRCGVENTPRFKKTVFSVMPWVRFEMGCNGYFKVAWSHLIFSCSSHKSHMTDCYLSFIFLLYCPCFTTVTQYQRRLQYIFNYSHGLGILGDFIREVLFFIIK